MGSINKVILIGRLGRDPEECRTGGGTRVSSFSLATDQYRPDRDGGSQKTTEWHRVVAYGKIAEQCIQYLRKGRQVCIEGSLQTRSWEKPAGTKRYTTEVIAARVTFLGSRPEGAAAEQAELAAVGSDEGVFEDEEPGDGSRLGLLSPGAG